MVLYLKIYKVIIFHVNYSQICQRLACFANLYNALLIIVIGIPLSSFAIQQEKIFFPDVGVPVYNTYLNIDVKNQELHTTTEFSYLADEETSGRVAFILNGGLEILDVSGPMISSYQYGPFQFVPEWNLIEISLNERVAPGDTVLLKLEYQGQLTLSGEHESEMFTSEWIDLNFDAMWHPIFAGFDQYMKGILHLKLPEGWEVVASGTGKYEDGMHVIFNDILQIDVAFAASPSFNIKESEYLAVHFHKASSQKVSAVLEAGENCSIYLNEQYGVYDPIPFSKFVIADRPGHAYARKNYIVLSVDDIDPAETVRLHRFLCHELAHYWTPSPGPFSPDHWMSEAFAELVAGRYVRKHFGEEEFNRYLTMWERQGRDHGPLWTPELVERPSFELMYRRAPFILNSLEQKIGTEKFDIFLMRYMTENIIYTLELLNILEEIAGYEATEWFKDELARAP